MDDLHEFVRGEGNGRIATCSALAGLRELPNKFFHCAVTSPPYYGLRAYDTEPSVWGGSAQCEHEWGNVLPPLHPGQVEQTKWKNANAAGAGGNASTGQYCSKCAAWRGHLGLEPTPEMFVMHLTEIFRELRRVLRSDGTFWVNIGDCYAKTTKGSGTPTDKNGRGEGYIGAGVPQGCKVKDLIGIPWMLAFAMRADGWYLRQEIVWTKTNPLPESTKDRPACATEKIFLFTRSKHYYYDLEAERVPSTKRSAGNNFHRPERLSFTTDAGDSREDARAWEASEDRNLWNYWLIGSEGFKGAHFAVFPSEIPRRCISLGSSLKGCCPNCSAPWRRIVERSRKATRPARETKLEGHDDAEVGHRDKQRHVTTRTTLGWEPACECDVHGEPDMCRVIDPFSGSGTTVLTALRMGRRALGLELSEKYAGISRTRIAESIGLFA